MVFDGFTPNAEEIFWRWMSILSVLLGIVMAYIIIGYFDRTRPPSIEDIVHNTDDVLENNDSKRG